MGAVEMVVFSKARRGGVLWLFVGGESGLLALCKIQREVKRGICLSVVLVVSTKV